MSRFLTFPALQEKKGHPHCRRHTERLVKEGKFPQPIKFGARVVWLEDEADAHYARIIEAQRPARRLTPPPRRGPR